MNSHAAGFVMPESELWPAALCRLQGAAGRGLSASLSPELRLTSARLHRGHAEHPAPRAAAGWQAAMEGLVAYDLDDDETSVSGAPSGTPSHCPGRPLPGTPPSRAGAAVGPRGWEAAAAASTRLDGARTSVHVRATSACALSRALACRKMCAGEPESAVKTQKSCERSLSGRALHMHATGQLRDVAAPGRTVFHCGQGGLPSPCARGIKGPAHAGVTIEVVYSPPGAARAAVMPLGKVQLSCGEFCRLIQQLLPLYMRTSQDPLARCVGQPSASLPRRMGHVTSHVHGISAASFPPGHP